jgi:3-deoxy-7-phosphoheptulonate synthase
MNVNLNLSSLENWGLGLTSDNPLVISGPCSAESENQVMETCVRLANSGKVNILRAGIWKPRTRPNCFEGIGSVGLKWLKAASKETGLPTTVEVANVKHVYEALRMGIDILWIGARTTVNPFAVQEIADALRGVDIPVMVKNPVNPDLPLWMGALERLNQAGITKLGAIHRGFSAYGETKYRNKPQWNIPIELKRQLPNIPLVCDPSHICGRRDTLHIVSQKAMDLDFDGLMIESHITPDKALSDARQQVTPERCHEILDGLVRRQTSTNDEIFQHTLDDLRQKIDLVDLEVLDIFAKRMEVATEIGRFKKANGITILQASRWDKIIKSRCRVGVEKGLTKDFIEDLYTAIHKESIRQQAKIMNDTTVDKYLLEIEKK